MIRSIVSVSRRKSKMPSSAANQSARAFSIVSEISARSCAVGPAERQIGAIDRKMQDIELERLPQAVGGKVAGGVVSAGDTREQPRQHGEFAGQQGLQHPALGVLQDRLQPRRDIADLPPYLVERVEARPSTSTCVMALSHS